MLLQPASHWTQQNWCHVTVLGGLLPPSSWEPFKNRISLCTFVLPSVLYAVHFAVVVTCDYQI